MDGKQEGSTIIEEPVANPVNNQNQKKMLHWWVSTFLITLLPQLLMALMSVLRGSVIDFMRMIGDGELVLSAFILSASSLIKHYNEGKEKNEILYYWQLFSSFFILISYATLKTNSENIPYIIILTSIISISMAFGFSWWCEKFIRGSK